MYRNIPNDPSKDFLLFEGCDFTVNSDCWKRIGGVSNGIIMTKCNNSVMPKYCKYTGIPGVSEDLMLYLTDYDNYECTSIEEMNIYQERLANLATDLRDAYLYGLTPKWVPHKVKFASSFNSLKGIKEHWVTYECITYGYNPKNGNDEIGF